MRQVHIWVPAAIEAEFREAAENRCTLEAAFGVLARDTAGAVARGRSRAHAYAHKSEAVLSTRIADDLHAELSGNPLSIARQCSLILIAHAGRIQEELNLALEGLEAEAEAVT